MIESTEHRFPPHLLRGTPSISPIADLGQLRTEQAIQQLPLDDNVTEILAGRQYAYAVMQPERATLVIRRLKNARWQIAILKAKGGARVKRETMQAIEKWLEQRNAWLPWVGTDYAIRI